MEAIHLAKHHDPITNYILHNDDDEKNIAIIAVSTDEQDVTAAVCQAIQEELYAGEGHITVNIDKVLQLYPHYRIEASGLDGEEEWAYTFSLEMQPTY